MKTRMKRFNVTLLALCFAALFTGCQGKLGQDESDSSEKVKENTVENSALRIKQETTSAKNLTVNIFIENSVSMQGYVQGNEFKKTITRVVSNLESKFHENVKIYFIGTTSTTTVSVKPAISGSLVNFLKHIKVSSFDKGTSAFGQIISNITNRNNDSTVSLLITDNIISTFDESGSSTTDGLPYQTTEITSAVEIACSKDANFNYILTKHTSNFTGEYYDRNDTPTTLSNKKRPFTIALMGNVNLVDSVYKITRLGDPLDFNNVQGLVSFRTNTAAIKKASFELISDRGWDNYTPKIKSGARKIIVRNPSKSDKLQFTVKLTLNDDHIEESFALDKSNYSIKDSLYLINDIVANGGNKYSIKLESRYKGSPKYCEISLLRSLPKFVAASSTKDDTDITNKIDKTFEFESFVKAIDDGFRHSTPTGNYEKLVTASFIIESQNSYFGTIMITIFLLTTLAVFYIFLKKRKQNN
jgi:hypothetical protein